MKAPVFAREARERIRREGLDCNMGGPRSRSRSQRVRATLLGNDHGLIRMPRVLEVGLDFGGHYDPMLVVEALLEKANIDDPEMLRTRFETPSEPCICRPLPRRHRLPSTTGPIDEVLQQVLMLGLSTALLYDPARPVILTRASLTRRLVLYQAEGFYA